MGAGWTRWYRPGGDIRPKLFLPVNGWPEVRLSAVMGAHPWTRATSYPPRIENRWSFFERVKSWSDRYTEAFKGPELYRLGNAEHFQFRTQIGGRFADDDETPGTWLGQPRSSNAGRMKLADQIRSRYRIGSDCGPGCHAIEKRFEDDPEFTHDVTSSNLPCHEPAHVGGPSEYVCRVHSGVHYTYPTKGTLLRNIHP